MYLTHPVPEGLRLLDTAPVPRPSAAALARVEAIWERETVKRPELFNGSIFSLASIEGSEAVGFLAEYKWYVAQLADPSLFEELRVRSLAVSGLMVANGHVFFGLRKPHLAIEGDLWELVPSGTIHGDAREPDGSLSWRKAFGEELVEELGISPPLDLARAFALVEDDVTHIWELGVAMELDMDHQDVLAAFMGLPRAEHAEMSALPLAEVPRFVKLGRRRMVGVCPRMLAAYGLIPAD